MCMCACRHMCHSTHMEVRGQLCGVGSIYPNVVSRDQTLVIRPVRQVPVPTDPSYPKLSILVVKVCIFS